MYVWSNVWSVSMATIIWDSLTYRQTVPCLESHLLEIGNGRRGWSESLRNRLCRKWKRRARVVHCYFFSVSYCRCIMSSDETIVYQSSHGSSHDPPIYFGINNSTKLHYYLCSVSISIASSPRLAMGDICVILKSSCTMPKKDSLCITCYLPVLIASFQEIVTSASIGNTILVRTNMPYISFNNDWL